MFDGKAAFFGEKGVQSKGIWAAGQALEIPSGKLMYYNKQTQQWIQVHKGKFKVMRDEASGKVWLQAHDPQTKVLRTNQTVTIWDGKKETKERTGGKVPVHTYTYQAIESENTADTSVAGSDPIILRRTFAAALGASLTFVDMTMSKRCTDAPPDGLAGEHLPRIATS